MGSFYSREKLCATTHWCLGHMISLLWQLPSHLVGWQNQFPTFPSMCCLMMQDAIACHLNCHMGNMQKSKSLLLLVSPCNVTNSDRKETTKVNITSLKKNCSQAMTVPLASISVITRKKAHTGCEKRIHHYYFNNMIVFFVEVKYLMIL